MVANVAPSDSVQLIAQEIQAFRDGVRNLRVTPMVSNAEIRRRLESYTFAQQVPLSDILDKALRSALGPGKSGDGTR